VRVIDGTTDSVIAKLRVEGWATDLCYNPRSNKVYSANCRSYMYPESTVTVIDGATDTVITTVRVGWYPVALCYNAADNKVYCADPSYVTVIDGEDDSVITTVRCSPSPVALCYDSVHNKVYVAIEYNGGGNTVTVIDGATDSVCGVLTVGAGPRALCLNSMRNRVYVANCAGSSISVIRTTPPGIEESFGLKLPKPSPLATVVRGVLFLPEVASSISRTASLLDVSGRKVLSLRPGANDVRALAPGVYFVREQSVVSSQHSGTENGVRCTVHVRKVVVTR
jgi:YVTN family beta-propeller protein